MSGFLKRTKAVETVNPAGGVNPALSPNVTQYGWTSFDAGNVNQLIEYVNICKETLVTVDEKIAYMEKLIEDFENRLNNP